MTQAWDGTITKQRDPTGLAPKVLAKCMANVRTRAFWLARRLPAHVSVDDLIGAGYEGLARAIVSNSGAPAEFEAYANIRAQGAMLDALRATDHLSRDHRMLKRQLLFAERQIAQELGRASTELELADRLGLTVERLRALTEVDEAGHRAMRQPDVMEDGEPIEAPDDAPSPEEQLAELEERDLLNDRIAALLRMLPQRHQVVLSLYYEHDWTLQRIGKHLGLTESRACQLHKEALWMLERARRGLSTRPKRKYVRKEQSPPAAT